MNSQQWENDMLLFKLHMQMLESEREGMIAENRRCSDAGDSIKYGYDDFIKLADKYYVHDNSFPTYR